MVIGVLDDEKVWEDKIVHCIENYFFLIDYKDYEIVRFSSGRELLSSTILIDILFLDVELDGEENGFDLAGKLLEKKGKITICFLTSHIEFARLGYQFNALRYIDKLHLEEIDEALAAYLNNIAKEPFISCKASDGSDVEVNVLDALFIEKNNRKILYHMADGAEFYGEGNLKDIVTNFAKSGIVQIQRSYAVNMKFIRSYDSRHLTMINDSEISIGRDRLQEFKKKYFEWRRNTI